MKEASSNYIPSVMSSCSSNTRQYSRNIIFNQTPFYKSKYAYRIDGRISFLEPSKLVSMPRASTWKKFSPFKTFYNQQRKLISQSNQIEREDRKYETLIGFLKKLAKIHKDENYKDTALYLTNSTKTISEFNSLGNLKSTRECSTNDSSRIQSVSSNRLLPKKLRNSKDPIINTETYIPHINTLKPIYNNNKISIRSKIQKKLIIRLPLPDSLSLCNSLPSRKPSLRFMNILLKESNEVHGRGILSTTSKSNIVK